ncbi:MAG: GldG family protein [Myxococcota bacterium]|nr:GldG family protein [Myxococcota bacterium]
MTGWPALFGALGLVFVVFGLLSVLLLLAGAPTDLTWIWANFAVGIALLVGAVATNVETIRERLSSGEGRRIGKYGTSAVVQTIVLIGIIAMLGFLANRYHVKWDVSEAGIHSLSDQTHKVLEGLERDVEVVALFPKLQQPPARELLEKYQYVSERFQVEFADPNARPDLVERFGITPEALGQGLIRVAIGDESVEIDEVGEERLTNALVSLTRGSEKKIYFLSGHNERPVEGKGADDKEGFARAADALRNENYRFETLLLAAKGDVPDDADAVVIAGATRPLLPVEHDALDRYLARGGAVLAMVDPRSNSDVDQALARWGVTVGDDAIVDRVQGMFGQAMSPLAGEYGNHEITADMREVTLFPMARSVQAKADGGGAFTEIVRTSSNSWAERDLDLLFAEGQAELGADDLRGPVPIALAGRPGLNGSPTTGDAEPRLVVFGDSDFASNQMLDAYRNRDLFLNSVNWLIGDVEAISIRPVQSRASRLTLSTEQFSQIRYLSLFVLPEAIAVVGVLAWWMRRRAPGR